MHVLCPISKSSPPAYDAVQISERVHDADAERLVKPFAVSGRHDHLHRPCVEITQVRCLGDELFGNRRYVLQERQSVGYLQNRLLDFDTRV